MSWSLLRFSECLFLAVLAIDVRGEGMVVVAPVCMSGGMLAVCVVSLDASCFSVCCYCSSCSTGVVSVIRIIEWIISIRFTGTSLF